MPIGKIKTVFDVVADGVFAARKNRIGDVRPLEGGPVTANIPGQGTTYLGQNSAIINSAEQYANDSGLKLLTPTQYLPIEEQFSRRVADSYQNMIDDPGNPRVQQAYNALSNETMEQYEQMLRDGINPFFINDNDPYGASPYLALQDLYQNKQLGVFKTTPDSFGSDNGFDFTQHPLLQETPFKIGGQPVLVNDAFRAVHDYYGHGKHGFGFRGAGEDNAYLAHSGMYSPDAMRAIATETRGQNSWLNYGPFGNTNRTAGIDDTIFADQKTGLLPNQDIMYRTPLAQQRLDRINAEGSRGLRGSLDGVLSDDGLVEAVHYGRDKHDVIDPNKYSSGLSGRTIPERNMAAWPEWDNRSFYGLETKDRPYRKEQGLGNTPNKVEVRLEQIYDILADPDGFQQLPDVQARYGQNGWYPLLTRKINDAGYTAIFQDHPKLGKILSVFDALKTKQLAVIPIAALGTPMVYDYMSQPESQPVLSEAM